MTARVPLSDIAYARSGDKGGDANVGVWVNSREKYELLRDQLTEDAVAHHFSAICFGGVTRYEVPNLLALNFILHDALDGGGAASLRTDAQGKTISLGLLQMRIDLPTQDIP